MPRLHTAAGVMALFLAVLPLSLGNSENSGHRGLPGALRQEAQAMAPSGTAESVKGYPGDALKEPLLVAAEDQRLIRVRTAAVAARMRGEKLVVPFLVSTGSSRTLVLTPRSSSYTIDDLRGLTPDSVVRGPDGAYLLSESILIQSGAGLSLSAPEGLTLRMASTPAAFVSIVNDGGKLDISGTPDSPARISSWDPIKGAASASTSNGRAYLRSVGGSTAVSNARFESLGFWAGRTGGLALTGTDRPTNAAPQTTRTPRSPAPRTTSPSPGAAGPVAPVGPRMLEADPAAPADNFATGSIRNSTITGNAFGIFVSKSRDVDISSVAVQNSLVDGIVLHRYVTNTRVNDTTASHNAGNGFVLARATAGITLNRAGADYNGRSGICIKGFPLAEGPSAGGDSGTISTDHTVADSHTTGNGRYGIEVAGGRNIGLHANAVSANARGIDLSRGVSGATIDGNRFENQKTVSISVVDGAKDTTVVGNNVSGGTTAVYLRDTPATVAQNTMTGLASHGITVKGTAAVQIYANTISGSGPSALNLRDSHHGVILGTNDTQGWEKTAPFWVRVANFFQPLTIVWTLLSLLLLLTALKGRRWRRKIVNPYAAQAPLATFTSSQPSGVLPKPGASKLFQDPAHSRGRHS